MDPFDREHTERAVVGAILSKALMRLKASLLAARIPRPAARATVIDFSLSGCYDGESHVP